MYFKKSFRCNDAKFLYYVNINTWLICQGILRPPPGLKTDVDVCDIFWYEQVCDEFCHKEHNYDP